MSDDGPNYARMETMRRLGVKFVHCSECLGTMREPADPFQGPHVIWGPPLDGVVPHPRPHEADETLHYVCSSGCHDKVRARMRKLERRVSTLKRDRIRAAGRRS